MSYNTAHEDEFGTGRRPYTSASTQREDHLLPTPTTSVGADGSSLDPALSARPFKLSDEDASTICDEAGRSSSVTPTNDNQSTRAGGPVDPDLVENLGRRSRYAPVLSIEDAIERNLYHLRLMSEQLRDFSISSVADDASVNAVPSSNLSPPDSQSLHSDSRKQDLARQRDEKISQFAMKQSVDSLAGLETMFKQYRQLNEAAEAARAAEAAKLKRALHRSEKECKALREQRDALKLENDQLQQEQLEQVNPKEGKSEQSSKKFVLNWKKKWGNTDRAKGADEAE